VPVVPPVAVVDDAYAEADPTQLNDARQRIMLQESKLELAQ
jgi:hypothetical protein